MELEVRTLLRQASTEAAWSGRSGTQTIARCAMNPQRVQYWKSNVRLMTVLMIVWAVVSYGFSIFFVEQLNAFSLGGFPLGFWFAQQGSIYVFVLLIFIYVLLMSRIDRKYDVHE
jgi:putative solute:sodium symporter small subunit